MNNGFLALWWQSAPHRAGLAGPEVSRRRARQGSGAGARVVRFDCIPAFSSWFTIAHVGYKAGHSPLLSRMAHTKRSLGVWCGLALGLGATCGQRLPASADRSTVASLPKRKKGTPDPEKTLPAPPVGFSPESQATSRLPPPIDWGGGVEKAAESHPKNA